MKPQKPSVGGGGSNSASTPYTGFVTRDSQPLDGVLPIELHPHVRLVTYGRQHRRRAPCADAFCLDAARHPYQKPSYTCQESNPLQDVPAPRFELGVCSALADHSAPAPASMSGLSLTEDTPAPSPPRLRREVLKSRIPITKNTNNITYFHEARGRAYNTPCAFAARTTASTAVLTAL